MAICVGDTACMREFTGKFIEILFSTDAKIVGKRSLVLKEKRNSFIVRDKERDLLLPKANMIFKIKFNDCESIIDGRKILFSPEQRTKRYLR
ncbi:MAG: ribonuclease P protein subunit [Candidatus Anstonellales archaeon]